MNIAVKFLIFAGMMLLCMEATVSAPPETVDVTQAADANNQFGFELLRTFQKAEHSDANIVVSPFSITSALRMVLAGARGETASEIMSTLHLTADGSANHIEYSALSNSLAESAAEGESILRFPGRLWGSPGPDYQPTFLAVLRQTFGAELFVLNFAGGPDRAVREINRWIAEQTSGHIRDLASPQMINSDTTLLLTNAVYFRGQWLRPFFVESTVEHPFRVARDVTETVQMMRQSGQFRYLKTDDLELLNLPYRGDRLSLVVILPSDPETLTELVARMNADRIRSLLTRAEITSVDVSLPKFSAATSCSLKERLMHLGMTQAFGSTADLSAMTGKSNLYLTDVAHQTFISVDEFGTEAASATGVLIAKSADEPMASFVADHPFLFLLIDQKTGTILFQGRIQHPMESNPARSEQQNN